MAEQYQTFPGRRGASNSAEKLRLLGLPDLKEKSFLDVGCNEGFFCAAAMDAGASKAVGIDLSEEFLSRARKQFPAAEFRQQSWDDLIEGLYDVVLMASSIHYAKDQPALIHKLMERLTPNGVLVLELGVANDTGRDYVEYRRSAGDVRSYPTFGALDQVLEGYSYRVAGKSVPQSGDPVPRWVVHVRHRRPIILFFDAPSFSGKSTTVRMIAKGRSRFQSGMRVVAVDQVFLDIEEALIDRYPAHREIIERIATFKCATSVMANALMDFIGEAGLVPAFVDFVKEYALDGAETVIWDGYIPAAMKPAFRSRFHDAGYVVWSCEPFGSLDNDRLDVGRVLSRLQFIGSSEA